MAFTPGLELNRSFYFSAVRPLIASAFPRLVYSAALLGPGSDVLGYDTPRSTDHDWGLRMQVFLGKRDEASLNRSLWKHLSHNLPVAFRGHSTHYGPPGKARGEIGIRKPAFISGGPVQHRIAIVTVKKFFTRELGLDPSSSLSSIDWLLMPQQQLLSVTSGTVFHDGLGQLNPLRGKLAFYPSQVWLYMLAAQWQRINQEEPFPGRCEEAGDELGSRILIARLVRDVMRLCFLMEREYTPYSKWIGTAFSHLRCGPSMIRHLTKALSARYWPQRERSLCNAYTRAAKLHNTLHLTPPILPAVSRFHGRPYLVLHSGRFVDALVKTLHDPRLRRLASSRNLLFGSVDQIADSTDLNGYPQRCWKLKRLYS